MSDSVIGLDDVEVAIGCLMADRGLRGVLIRGPPGVGKSVAVREAVRRYTGREPVIVPSGISESQLFGSLDMERAIIDGSFELEKGVISRADGGLLVIDDVNLMDRRLLHVLMSSMRSGIVTVERDGMSAQYGCDVGVVATVNSKDVPMERTILDLFDICVTILPSDDPDSRSSVIRVNIDSDDDDVPDAPIPVADTDGVTLDDDRLREIIKVCQSFGLVGYRGELSTARTAMALAAMDGRKHVSEEDISHALALCLEHRRERARVKVDDGEDRVILFDDSLESSQSSEGMSDEGVVDICVESIQEGVSDDPTEEIIMGIGELFEAIDDKENSNGGLLDARMLRKSIRGDGREGRYVSSRPLNEGNTDIALDATIRNAAPYQKSRGRTLDSGLIIRRTDIMEKVREQRTSCLFFFMVDNSGSLIIRRRMKAVKAAVLTILSDNYIRRDSVAIMTFNESFIGMIQPPTRSVGRIRRILEDMPVGRKTPLSEALVYSDRYLSQYLRKHPADRCMVILMTDAGANIAMRENEDPFEEAISIAKGIDVDRAVWTLIDLSTKAEDRERASELARALRASYHRLESLYSTRGI